MVDKTSPEAKMESLRGQLAGLHDMVETCATDCRLYKIVQYDQNDRVPEVIEPVIDAGTNAVSRAQHALQDLSRPIDANPANVTRTPGVVVVDKDLTRMIERINKQKDDLKKLIITTYPDPRARRAFTNLEFKGRIMLQVYRHIYTNQKTKGKPAVTRVPERIRFTWSPYTLTSTPLTKKEALRHVLAAKERIADVSTLIMLDMTLDRIKSRPSDTSFRIRKPRAPFPKANIYYGKRDFVDVPAHLPLVIYSKTPLKIDDLPVYDKAERRKPKATAMKTAPICQRLNLHEVI